MADTVAFGSMDWLDAYVDIFNENPTAKAALADFSGSVGYEFTDRPDIPPKYVVITNGEIKEHGEVTDPVSLMYFVRANYDVWKAMTLEELDPMNALMSGKLKVTGNMAALMKHAEGFKETFEVVQKIPTAFD